VLTGNDVLNMKNVEPVMFLPEPAILTAVAGALTDQAAKLRVRQEAACCLR
jgi:hypothetical protein